MDFKHTQKAHFLKWDEIKEDIKTSNEVLFDIINNIQPNEEDKLIKLTYNFGDFIVEKGQFKLPSGIDNDELSKEILSQIEYCSIPLFLLLNKGSEVAVSTPTRVIPLNFFEKGNFLGLFELSDFISQKKSNPIWDVFAGARSIFMLPKITETQSFIRLSHKYGLPMLSQPKSIFDHWQLFSEISSKDYSKNAWKSHIIVFPQKWIMKLLLEKWSPLREYLLKETWQSAGLAIEKIKTGLNWQSMINVISKRRLKPKPYLIEHVRHILAMAEEKYPGFRPADNTESAAPSTLIEKAFIETYQIKTFLPTLMHIQPVDTLQKSPIYYSLSFPTLLEGIENRRGSRTLMSDLKEVKLMIETLLNNKKKSCFSNLNHVFFEFFHIEADENNEIQPSSLIPEKDPSFLMLSKQYPDYTFCKTSPFFKGCVRISLEKGGN